MARKDRTERWNSQRWLRSISEDGACCESLMAWRQPLGLSKKSTVSCTCCLSTYACLCMYVQWQRKFKSDWGISWSHSQVPTKSILQEWEEAQNEQSLTPKMQVRREKQLEAAETGHMSIESDGGSQTRKTAVKQNGQEWRAHSWLLKCLRKISR